MLEQHQNLATGVPRLLNEQYGSFVEDSRADFGRRAMLTVIKGGRRAAVVGP
jgi:hypothetical protein